MKIDQSHVHMEAQTEQIRVRSVTESLRVWKDQPEDNLAGRGGIHLSLSAPGLEKSHLMKKEEGLASSSTAPLQGSEPESDFSLDEKSKAKIRLIEDFVFLFTGKRIKILIPSHPKDPENAARANAMQARAVKHGEAPQRLGWGIDYQYHEQIHEREALQFASTGQVKTADGRTIDFHVQFAMSREFSSETRVSFQAGDALIDPLVVNLSASTAALGERNFRFDLDMDGEEDTISFVAPGSGFLALDRNGNGMIDDGSELFGPTTGNGFQELGQYDADANGWIDENDPIFDKLRIWSKDSEGNLQLEALGKSGIGAIYLGNVTTPFRLISSQGQMDGRIAHSGVYLRENGSAGTVQHIDLNI